MEENNTSAKSIARGVGGSGMLRGSRPETPDRQSTRPASEIERELGMLERHICETHQLLEELAKKLSPVLRDIIDQKGDVLEKEMSCESIVGRSIRGNSERARTANRAILELIDRVTV